MAKLEFYKGRFRSSGFSLFELVIVLAVSAILFSAMVARYDSKISEAQRSMISFQASVFSRSVENVRAISTIENSDEVHIGGGIFVYLNDDGWPFSSNLFDVKGGSKQSLSACNSLWQSLFSSAVFDDGSERYPVQNNFEISLINNHICRYKLVRKKEGFNFFDYDVKTGSVVVTLTQS